MDEKMEPQTRKTFAIEKIIDSLAAGNLELANRAKALSRSSKGILSPQVCIDTVRQDLTEETLANAPVF